MVSRSLVLRAALAAGFAGAVGCSSSDGAAPVLTSVEPASTAFGVPQPVRIHGRFWLSVHVDFAEAKGSYVRADYQATLDGIALESVRLVDGSTIEAVVPATLGLGSHELAVTDAEGRETRLADAFTVTAACWQDLDGDGFGSAVPIARTAEQCTGGAAGVRVTGDCDDDPAGCGAACHPGATEVPADGRDEDCDGHEACYEDLDGDGYGSSIVVLAPGLDCNAAGMAWLTGDCDDDPGACGAGCHPGATEVPGDGLDEDCDGRELCWVDADGDGFGAGAPVPAPGLTCAVPGLAPAGGDCDDGSADTFPGAAPGDSPPGACRKDADHDDFGDASPPAGVTAGTDCNDGNAGLYVLRTGWVDGDGDGHGAGAAVQVCSGATLPPGYSTDGTDCNDGNAGLYVLRTGWVDGDGDGYGAGAAVEVCSGATLPAGYSTDGTDCNDGNGGLYVLRTGYVDADGDGFGAGAAVQVCSGATLPPGYSTVGGDCDDGRADTFPGAAPHDSTTLCMRDQDGDDWGAASPGVGVSAGTDCNDVSAAVHVSQTAYADGDGDGYGAGPLVPLCTDGTLPAGYSLVGGDCDDGRADTFPGAAPKDSETLCMKDQDGDDWGDASAGGAVTAGTDCNDADPAVHVSQIGHRDADGDGYGAAAPTTLCTAGTLPAGYVTDASDCDDGSAVTYPGAAANDSPPEACRKDADHDGYGDQSPPAGVTAGTDCNDADGAVHVLRSGYVDADKDGFGVGAVQSVCSGASLPVGYASVGGDCNDTDGFAYPGAAPNDSTTACMEDRDGDDWGNASPPAGVTAGTDCNDNDPTVYPGSKCDDTNACTWYDACFGGVCRGINTCNGQCGSSCATCPAQGCCIDYGCSGVCSSCTAGCSCAYYCDTVPSCQLSCAAGSRCGFRLSNSLAATGTLTCNGADCAVECQGGQQCTMSCTNGGRCELTCTLAVGTCEVSCDASSHCLVHCNDAVSCAANCTAPVTCPGAVIVCNEACP